jgi:ribonuclease Z
MSLKLTILGCHSATPRSFANPTAQYLEINDRGFLIDCGEGTQTQLRKYKIKFSQIKHIFISHLHGDHIYGLIGLISSFGLLSRQTDLHIFAPKELEGLITMQLSITKSWVSFPIIFHPLTSKNSELIFEDKKVEVHTIPLKHRIYTNGFLFKEKSKDRKLNMKTIKEHPQIALCDYHKIKKGYDFTGAEGEIIPNSELTFDPPKILQYAFCSDTAYSKKIIPLIREVDLLYHESTFLEDNKALAKLTRHSTALEAATIAKEAGVNKLILGHYSSRYKNEALFLSEASQVFSHVELAEQGKVFIIYNQT